MLARGGPNDAVIAVFQPLLRSRQKNSETRTPEDEKYDEDEELPATTHAK